MLPELNFDLVLQSSVRSGYAAVGVWGAIITFIHYFWEGPTVYWTLWAFFFGTIAIIIFTFALIALLNYFGRTEGLFGYVHLRERIDDFMESSRGVSFLEAIERRATRPPKAPPTTANCDWLHVTVIGSPLRNETSKEELVASHLGSLTPIPS